MFKDLVLKNRSYRRFVEERRISTDELKELVELARNVPSTVNSQAIRFRLVNDADTCDKVFGTLGWAGLLKDWPGPQKGERPAAYIVLLCDQTVGKDKKYDDGICAQTILLGAVEKGLGGCMLGNVKRDVLAEILGIDTERYSIDLVVALGKPDEKVVLTEVGEEGSTAYYRDDSGVHYVPKRKLDDLIV